VIYYVDGLKQAVAHTYTQTNTPSPARTTTTLRPAQEQPKARVFNHLPAAERHRQRHTANSPPAASYGARHGHTPLAEPKSLPPNTCDTENAVATLVGAIPYIYKTVAPISAATARLQPTQQ
jgi:hypothetical protein